MKRKQLSSASGAPADDSSHTPSNLTRSNISTSQDNRLEPRDSAENTLFNNNSIVFWPDFFFKFRRHRLDLTPPRSHSPRHVSHLDRSKLGVNVSVRQPRTFSSLGTVHSSLFVLYSRKCCRIVETSFILVAACRSVACE